MHFLSRCLCLLPLCILPVAADFLGPSYPAPLDLTSDSSLVAASWKNLTATLLSNANDTTSTGVTAALSNITFSLGLFSLNDPAASQLQYHYTSPEIQNAVTGTHKADGDSIYRIASVTKAFTVLAGLLELKPEEWERPLSEIFPALGKYASQNSGESDPIHRSPWDQVTPSALAAQIAGVKRDISPVSPGEILAQVASAQQAEMLGLPPPNMTDPLEFPPCTLLASCTVDQYIQGAEDKPPTFLPWTSPGYSDNGFILLGMAIAKITGKNIEDIYRQGIFEPLGMTSSNSSTPPESVWYRSVIPGDVSTTFAFDAGIIVSTGGLSSTTQDLAKFGTAILNSTLLETDQTHKWLKPVSHTARFQYSLGRPWEIMRYTLPSGHVTDIYAKSGSSGAYNSWLALLPDYNAGFTVLSASSLETSFKTVAVLADLITDAVVPALEAQAVVEARVNLAGSYVSTVQGLNSSLTLVLDQSDSSPPGLVVSSWISNGTDMLSTFEPDFGPGPYRLLPSISDPKSKEVAFRLVSAIDAPSPQPSPGLFSGQGFVTSDWIDVDSPAYGGIGLGLFVFDIGADSKATAVSPAALRVKLAKVN
jgi:CubicO group peptidase (beta-lactamase class C family)